MATTKSQELGAKLTELQIWFETNPNLPEKIQTIVLLRFLKCMHYDVNKTKAIIELNYSLRNKNSHLFIERNMDDERTAKGLKVSDLLILPGLTPERYKIILFRMADYDPTTRNSEEETKIFAMTTDARFTEPDIERDSVDRKGKFYLDDADIADGDVQIIDIAGFTMQHLAYLSVYVLRVHMKFTSDAYPSRLRAIHIINCPSFLDHMMAMMKHIIREEVFQMMNYHTEGMESLYKLVPRDMLPVEYGGKAGTIAEIKAHWMRKLREKSEYLSDEKYWKVRQQNTSDWSFF